MAKITGNTPDYWKIRRREHKHIQEQLNREDGYKKRLERLYRTAQEEIIRDIEADIGRFADKEGISMTEAKKRISKHDVEAFSEKAKRYVEERDFSPEANRELRLYNVTMRTNRLELLEARMHLETTALADEEIKMLQEWLGQEAIAEYTRQAGILGMTIPDQVQLNRMAKAIINAEFRNVEFSERVWQNQKELQHGLENTIRRTIIRGENPRVAGRELREYVNKEFENKKYAADRIAITESARVQSDIGEQAHKDAGITQFMWIAEPTACSICAGYDGEVYDYSDTGAPRVPAHPFCKCAESAYYDSTELDKRLEELALREHLDGHKPEPIPEPVAEYFESKDLDESIKYFRDKPGYKKWMKEMSSGQEDAINNYTGDMFKPMNAILRDDHNYISFIEEELGHDYLDEIGGALEDLRNILSEYTTEDNFKVARRVDPREIPEDIWNKVLDSKPGEVIMPDAGLASTSMSVENGRFGSVTYDIEIPEGKNVGAYIAEYAQWEEEDEFLLAPGVEFEVIENKLQLESRTIKLRAIGVNKDHTWYN